MVNKVGLYVDLAASEIAKCQNPADFDFQAFFIANGSEPNMAELLADYFPCACGRAFLSEIGVIVSDTYQRRTEAGDWSAPENFHDDPVWLIVEEFAEKIRVDQHRRKQFSLVAQHSAEVDAVNRAMNDGMKLSELRGSKISSVFHSSRKSET